MSIDNKLVGKRIRVARKAAGYSIEKLAEVTDLSRSYVSMLERGLRMPSLGTFVDIVNALDVTADPLLQDVLKLGSKVAATELSDRLTALSPSDYDRAIAVIDLMMKK